jgi:choline dehydrogenase-like flavoprotein
MQRISRPLAEAKDRYTVVVVGSGYGGGVAASRLSRAGQTVCVLERGRELLPGEYPTSTAGLISQTQVSSQGAEPVGAPTALFDFRVGDDITVLVGCGLGGTSLINANVALDADSRIFQSDGWPKALCEGPHSLDRYYARSKAMLGSTPYPEDFPQLRKLTALPASAAGMGQPFYRPPINVTFKTGPNAVGVQQAACTLCGDCTTGCNYGAKNTTLMNYLPDAFNHGAQIFTSAKVDHVARDGQLWKVLVEDVGGGAATDRKTPAVLREIVADVVVLAAGTLGSTEILLRSRERGLETSRMLGQGFSGNGDVLGFAYDCDLGNGDAKRPPVYGVGSGNVWPQQPDKEALRPGPCIAGIIDMRATDRVRDGLVIEDGVLPSGLAAACPPVFLFAEALSADRARFADEADRLKDAQALAKGVQDHTQQLSDLAYAGPVSRTQTFLLMSHETDALGGRLSLDRDRLSIAFPGVGRMPVFARNDHVLEQASEAVRGGYVRDPLWRRAAGRQLISVHPLGGCWMGESGASGVVDDRCQVFAGESGEIHEGLYVCDGSVVRGSLGVNPLLTISAIAERAMELLAQDKGWVVDYEFRTALPDRGSETRGTQPRADISAQPPAGAAHLAQAASAIPRIRQRMLEVKRHAGGKGVSLAARLASWFGRREAQAAEVLELMEQLARTTAGAKTQSVEIATLGKRIEATLASLADLERAIGTRDWGRAIEIVDDKFCDLSPGLQFSERMWGPFSTQVVGDTEAEGRRISDPFDLAARRGSAAGQDLVAEFHVAAASIEELTGGRDHAATLSGTITCPALSARPLTVGEGRLELLIEDPRSIESWLMIYSGWLEGGDAKLHFEGRKVLSKQSGASWWTNLTTLFVTVRRESKDGPVVGRGILHLGLQDLVRQVGTMSIGYEATAQSRGAGPREGALGDGFWRRTILRVLASEWPSVLPAMKYQAAAKLAAFFAEPIIRAHGGILPYLENYPAAENARRKRRIADNPPARLVPAPKPARVEIKTADDVTLALTRYQGGQRGPVIVAPGIGVIAASYAIDTVEVNLVEHLCRAGYDVWLFDYRASPALPSSTSSFTVDDIVKYDWPAAVDAVCRATGAKDVQVLAHCVSSLSLLMALLNGLQRVRSVIASQFSLHPVTHWFNYAKIDLDVGRLLDGGLTKYLADNLPLGNDAIATITRELSGMLPGSLPASLIKGLPYFDIRSSGSADDQTLDALLWNLPMPPQDHCKNPVCHRMFAVYGLALNHVHLNEATHNALVDIFGPISSRLFEQLRDIMGLGYAVDQNGQNTYLPHADRLTMPIMLLSGSHNQILMPESTQRTLAWLRSSNPAHAAIYSRHVFPTYAHMDLFVGKNADRDIFPFIEATLNAHNS